MSTVPVEGEHAACDGHVHWHLSRHPANHKHLLPCVGVEGWVVDVLGPPELILRQARFRFPSSETHVIMSPTSQICLLTYSICKINVSTQNWIFKLGLAPYWKDIFSTGISITDASLSCWSHQFQLIFILHSILFISWLSLPVVLHNDSGLLQCLRGQKDIPGICDHEEVLGTAHKCALVPSWFLYVYVEGQLSRHPGFPW